MGKAKKFLGFLENCFMDIPYRPEDIEFERNMQIIREKKAPAYKPQGWQLDPQKLDSDKVQLWRNGVMAGVISKMDAQEMVRQGRAFVVTGQAIGALTPEGMSNA